ncbi:hypothetical protein pb186bvf_013812 [Paramecium bursaria]
MTFHNKEHNMYLKCQPNNDQLLSLNKNYDYYLFNMMKTYLDHQVHSLNDSTSKQRYTIPKAPRELVKSSSISGDASYQLPSTLNSRFTTLGYGQKQFLNFNSFFRTNLVGKDNYPGPGQYEFKSIVEQDYDAKKGISFAVSRELMKQQSILGKINTYPSPDRYNLPQSIKDRKYTFGLRTQIKDHNTNPGNFLQFYSKRPWII